MSTNALIGIENEDGTIDAVHVHWDGDDAGKTLREHYNTHGLARALIDRGDISTLQERMGPFVDEKHSFDKPIPGVTVFYHRDRGEDLNVRTYSGIADYGDMREHGYEYLYLFADGEWHDSN